VKLEPNGKNWHGLAWALTSLQPPASREAEQAARQGIRLEPDHEYGYYQLARALSQQRRYEEAAAALNDALRIEPLFATGYAYLTRMHLENGKWQMALAVLDGMPPGLAPPVPTRGDPTASAGLWTALRAGAHAGLGEAEQALKLLDEALAAGYRQWEFLDSGVAFATLRSHQQFKSLVTKYRNRGRLETAPAVPH
jgi:tetratricopeptide (TPR) repeat protein